LIDMRSVPSPSIATTSNRHRLLSRPAQA
jgi:hypothetical protein